MYKYYDVATGVVTEVRGPNYTNYGFLYFAIETQEWEVDGFGRSTAHLVSELTGSTFTMRHIETSTYDDFASPARVTTQSRIDYGGSAWVTVEQERNGAGQLIQRRTQIDGPYWAVEGYSYVHGDMVSYTTSDPSVPSGEASVTYTYSYDELGRPTGMRRPSPFSHSGVDTRYDGRTTTRTDLAVDPGSGAPTTDGSGGTTVTVVDALGRLTTVTELDPVYGDATTTHAYDANDNLTSIVDADGFTTRMFHDYLSRRVAIVRNPGLYERRWEYQYDDTGNMTAEISPRPVGAAEAAYTTQMVYDQVDRIVRKIPAVRDLTSTELTQLNIGDTHYYYDDWRSLARGRLHRVELPFGSVDYAYDARGNTDSEVRGFALTHPITGELVSGSRSVSTTYNALNQPFFVAHDDGTLEASLYDSRGLPNRSLVLISGSWEELAVMKRNAAGVAVRRDTGFQQHREVEYDELGRPVADEVWDDDRLFCGFLGCSHIPVRLDWWNVSYLDSGDVREISSSPGRFSYGYDARRQIVQSSGPNGYAANLTYSGSGRILSADISWSPTGPGVPAPRVRDVDYAYDETVADPDAATELRRVSDGTLYGSYQYDESGNATVRELTAPNTTQIWRQRYDGDDRLRRATAPNGDHEYYYYDHDEQRMLVVAPGGGEVRFTFGGLETRYTASGSQIERRAHVSLGGQPVGRVKNSTTLELSYHAGRRDLLLALNKAGTITAGFTYGPFGEVVRTTGLSTGVEDHRRRFNDKQHDGHTGYTYYGYRYYDPVSLQWNRADPLYRFVPDAAQDAPRQANLYAFNVNNPVAYIDPDGRNPVLVALAGKCAANAGCRKAVGTAAVAAGKLVARNAVAIAVAAGIVAVAVKTLEMEDDLGPGQKRQSNVRKDPMESPRADAANTAAKASMEAREHKNKGAQEQGSTQKGGGKTGRKISKDAIAKGKTRVAKARANRDTLAAKKNKTKADKAALAKAKRTLKKAEDRLRASENHAQTGQGPRR